MQFITTHPGVFDEERVPMPTDVLYGKTLRKSFARTQEIMDMPNLLEIQKSSYEWFLKTGLKEVFQDVDAVTD